MWFEIQQETPEDEASIEALLDIAFGPARRSRTVYTLRRGVEPIASLCFTARDEKGKLLGSLRFWPVRLPDGGSEPLFGPLAVQPELRGLGIGKALVAQGVAAARESGHGAVLIVGDPAYYTPFGFSEAPVARLAMPGPVMPLTFMGLEFEPERLSRLEGVIAPVRESRARRAARPRAARR